ncbi:MAG: FAD-dependent oxidoreductase, partial [Betaproteobacteria bacterium]
MRADFAVLGAGMVGVCVALHLQKRGRAVVLVDRRGAAEETSFGNAGMIQREAVFPHPFPRELGAILRYARNRSIDASYHLAVLPQIAPFLWRYWRHSQPKRYAEITRSFARLIEHCVSEHDLLATEAGAMGLLRREGWIRVYRTDG